MKEIVHALISILGGCVAYMVGGFDTLFTTLVVLCIFDVILSGLKNLRKHQFSHTLFLWGFVNKIVVIIVVIGINFIQQSMQLPIPARESVIILLSVNEFLSNLRNASYFVKGLEPIVIFFEGIKLNIIKIFKVGDSIE